MVPGRIQKEREKRKGGFQTFNSAELNLKKRRTS